MTTLDERTSIQLWAVIVTLPVLAGGVFWLTTIYTDGLANAANISKVEHNVDKQNDLLLEINERVIRIEQQTKQGAK